MSDKKIDDPKLSSLHRHVPIGWKYPVETHDDGDGYPNPSIVSSRGIPLLAQQPSKLGKPIVTMENYEKWYSVEILHPDGTVTSADSDTLREIERGSGGVLMGDHNFHPRLLNELAKKIGGDVDWRALEMVTGRWILEIADGDIGGFLNANTPED